MSWLFESGGQSIGASVSASVQWILEMTEHSNEYFNEYSGLISFRIDWFDLAVKQTQEFPLASQFEGINSLALSLLYGPTPISVFT